MAKGAAGTTGLQGHPRLLLPVVPQFLNEPGRHPQRPDLPAFGGEKEQEPPLAERMVELAGAQPGFLGVQTVRGTDGFGITVSYWTDEAAIAARKRHAEHQVAQECGRSDWYAHYEIRIARVERAYGGPR